VKEVARAGRGSYCFVEENENLKAKVISALKKATQPSLKNVKIKWFENINLAPELEAPSGLTLGEVFRD
jgi:hypothetical protein